MIFLKKIVSKKKSFRKPFFLAQNGYFWSKIAFYGILLQLHFLFSHMEDIFDFDQKKWGHFEIFLEKSFKISVNFTIFGENWRGHFEIFREKLISGRTFQIFGPSVVPSMFLISGEGLPLNTNARKLFHPENRELLFYIRCATARKINLSYFETLDFFFLFLPIILKIFKNKFMISR